MTRTPTTCYEIPILEVLYDLGGCGYRAGIIERVRLRLKDVLTDADYAERPGKSQEVYEHHADSMAQRLPVHKPRVSEVTDMMNPNKSRSVSHGE